MVSTVFHLALHVVLPAAAARLFWPEHWKKAWLVMMLAAAIDLDHLLADPVYDPNRCSLGFHPLHSFPAAAAYAAMLFVPALRVLAAGLLIHLGVDATDCLRIGALAVL